MSKEYDVVVAGGGHQGLVAGVNYAELTSCPGYPKVFAKALRFSPATNWKENG